MTSDVDRHVDVREACRLLGLKRSKAYLLMDAGELPYIVPPNTRKRLIAISTINNFLARGQKSGAANDG